MRRLPERGGFMKTLVLLGLVSLNYSPVGSTLVSMDAVRAPVVRQLIQCHPLEGPPPIHCEGGVCICDARKRCHWVGCH